MPLFYRLYSIFLNVNNKKLSIGRSCVISRDSYFDSNVNILDYCRIFNSKVSSYSYVAPYSIMIDCSVGKYTSIGPGCRIGLGIHPVNELSTSPYLYNDNIFKKKNNSDFQNVIIGNDVWIGANVLIMGGVTIGHGAVIGAGAVVTKNLPPYSISIGVPAKTVKYRFDDSTINDLLRKPWWDLEHDIIIRHKQDFRCVEKYLKYGEVD
ncbi:CatB-related O-acetyltransferase [Vibrio splendidus]|uniref:CatB-related O-acetyltransferase n=1 Tax=Vibrio splendidus TaxID=29497 RepID=UPI0013001635|nr:CatB-related O-acetyltransferase [Vibrio splendidus]